MPQRLLNFVVVGDARAGTTPVVTAISGRVDATCHADLVGRDEPVCRHNHEAYFGADPPGQPPAWFIANVTNPFQYLSQSVFDQPRHGETAVGLRLYYAQVRAWELDELFSQRCHEGDFCLVHVLRNPVACFISMLQAERSGSRVRRPGEPLNDYPLPVAVDAAELTTFCRDHAATQRRLDAACDDALTVAYRDLLTDYQQTMRRVFDFLEIDDSEPAMPDCVRLRNRAFRDRVSDWGALRSGVPYDVRELMSAEDLC